MENMDCTVIIKYFELIDPVTAFIIVLAITLIIISYLIGTKHCGRNKVASIAAIQSGDLSHTNIPSVSGKSVLGIVDPSTPMTKKKLIEEIFYASHNAANEKFANRCIALLQNLPEAVNFRLEPSGYTPFLDACWAGSHKLVEYMLQHGADTNSTADDGNTPVYLATYSYVSKPCDAPFDPALIRSLVNFGCSVNQPKRSGHTPLHIAAKAGRFELVRCLLVNKADAEAVTSSGRTAADIAREKGHVKVANFLTVKCDPSDVVIVEPKVIADLRWHKPGQSGCSSSGKKTSAQSRRSQTERGSPDLFAEEQSFSDD